MDKIKKDYTPRYTICTISTTDPDILIKVDAVKHMGIGHNEIYLAGLKHYLDSQS